MQMMQDPELVAFARQARIDISPMEGEKLQKLVEDIGSTPKAIVAQAKAATNLGR
jgi:hypothetical protein